MLLVGVSNAAMTGAFALAGVLLAGAITWTSTWQARRASTLGADLAYTRKSQARLATLIRDGTIGIAQAWAAVIRADSQRTHSAGSDDGPARERTVHALTELGACFNGLLVLPISDEFERMIFKADQAVTAFRAAEYDRTGRLAARAAVGDQIVELIRLARKEGTV